MEVNQTSLLFVLMSCVGLMCMVLYLMYRLNRQDKTIHRAFDALSAIHAGTAETYEDEHGALRVRTVCKTTMGFHNNLGGK